RERGIAGLNGDKFDDPKLANQQAKLDTLADMEAVQREIDKAKADEKAHAETLVNQTKLRGYVNDHLQDMQEAQDHARALSASYSRILARMEDMGRTYRAYVVVAEPRSV